MESKLKCVFDLRHIEVNENLDSNKDSNLVSLTNSTKSTSEETLAACNEASQALTNMMFVTSYAKQPTSTEDNDLVEDNRKLRDEVAILRQELMQAKEEGLKKRISSKPLTHGPTYGGDALESSLANSEQLVLKNNTHILFFALFFFVVGVIFSKILL